MTSKQAFDGSSARTARQAAVVMLTTILLAVAGLSAVPTANAAEYYSSTLTGTNVNVRPCVNTASSTCNPVATSGSATRVRMTCWRDGSSATGNYTSVRWFLAELNTAGGPEGFIHSSFVTNQTEVPECGTLARVRAADWALGQVGQTRAPGEFNGMNWAPGPVGEWSGDCAKLVYLAYTRAGVGSYPLKNAIEQWNALPNKSAASRGYLPRYGDPVFWNIARPYGHTAIYVGGTRAVGTQGLDHDNLPVAIYDLNRYANYLGYAKAA
jgi:hypothetical protein